MLSWQEAYRASIKNIADLESALETQFTLSKDFTYPILIPQRILNKIKSEGFDSPIGQQFLPHKIEENDEGVIDPIGDKKTHKGTESFIDTKIEYYSPQQQIVLFYVVTALEKMSFQIKIKFFLKI